MVTLLSLAGLAPAPARRVLDEPLAFPGTPAGEELSKLLVGVLFTARARLRGPDAPFASVSLADALSIAVMQSRGFVAAWLVGVCSLVVACAGGSKPAESPETSAEAVEKPVATDKEPGAASPESKTEAKLPAADEGPKPSRSAADILTAPDVVFLFSFNDSEPKQVAEEKCDKKAGADAKKKNECMASARKAFPADGHRFKKDEKEQWWWITVRQNGNKLVALHKIPVEIAAETPTSVTLKPVGKDKGSAPMTPPAQIVFEVPNDYQIALQDPKAGKLVFQAKVGVVSE
jgi:hypothetical protein